MLALRCASAGGRILSWRSASPPWKNGLCAGPQRPAQLRELRGSHATSPFYLL